MTDEQMRETLEDLLEAVRLIYIQKGATGAAADMVRDQIQTKVRDALDRLEDAGAA